MFHSYVFSISHAFMAFPAAAFLFTLPFLIVQYRKYGYINKYRAFLLYLFLLYAMNALFLVLLPFPSTVHNEPPAVGSVVQSVPFQFIQDILQETSVDWQRPATYVRLLGERAFLQIAFNVLLLVPFGLFMRYYFRVGWAACLLASFGASLFFEVTQVTGIYGIFDHPYRLFDVDDLMSNTLGGMTGYLLGEAIARHLPRMDKLDEHVDLAKKRVSYTRRAVALLLDGVVLFPILILSAVLVSPFMAAAVFALYYIGITYWTNGRTFGKWIVRIRVKGKGERIRFVELLVRYGLLYGLLGGMNLLFILVIIRSLPAIAVMLYAAVLFAADAVVGVHLLRCLFNRNRKLFYERASGTAHVIT